MINYCPRVICSISAPGGGGERRDDRTDDCCNRTVRLSARWGLAGQDTYI